MRGIEGLIAMRLSGFTPLFVDIDVDAGEVRKGFYDRWREAGQTVAMLAVEESDRTIARLDFRAVVGLTVQVGGEDARRVEEVAKACAEAGAITVVAVVWKRGRGELIDIVSTTVQSKETTWQD